MQERIAGADTRRDRRAKEMTLPVSWPSDGVSKLMVVGFYRVLRLKHRLTMEIAEVPTAFRLTVRNIDGVRLDMNWSEVKGKNCGGTEPDSVVDVRDASATAVR